MYEKKGTWLKPQAERRDGGACLKDGWGFQCCGTQNGKAKHPCRASEPLPRARVSPPDAGYRGRPTKKWKSVGDFRPAVRTTSCSPRRKLQVSEPCLTPPLPGGGHGATQNADTPGGRVWPFWPCSARARCPWHLPRAPSARTFRAGCQFLLNLLSFSSLMGIQQTRSPSAERSTPLNKESHK